MSDGSISVMWEVSETDRGFYVETVVDGMNFGERIERQEPGAPLNRAVRNAVVSAIEYALSERMGLLPREIGQ